ncbi:hypothetical protein HZH66_014046 [Vespula vulgaris]|uniref:Uncharacterized protein n=1 Tax=Vespula vulgaris TaxID=7454 RepID=A0A834J555_VESVU|nr:hypothetical protein HZH66_014046 [Vespula vulgaris]
MRIPSFAQCSLSSGNDDLQLQCGSTCWCVDSVGICVDVDVGVGVDGCSGGGGVSGVGVGWVWVGTNGYPHHLKMIPSYNNNNNDDDDDDDDNDNNNSKWNARTQGERRTSGGTSGNGGGSSSSKISKRAKPVESEEEEEDYYYDEETEPVDERNNPTNEAPAVPPGFLSPSVREYLDLGKSIPVGKGKIVGRLRLRKQLILSGKRLSLASLSIDRIQEIYREEVV